MGSVDTCGGDFRLLMGSLRRCGGRKCEVTLLSNSHAETRELTGSLRRRKLTTFCKRSCSERVYPNRVVIICNRTGGNFRCPLVGFTMVARSSVFKRRRGGGGGGGCDKDHVRSFTRLSVNSFIIRRGRNLNVCQKVRGIRMSEVIGSCVGVRCENKDGLCVPTARLSYLRGCSKTSTSGTPGLGGLNARR